MNKAKLVRDKIPIIIKKSGKISVIKIAPKSQYRKLLLEKLVEETVELKKKFNKEEIADILEVIYSLIKSAGYNKNEIEKIRKRKSLERGSFNKKIVLVKVK
jgi:predicted house-cleaning noncanonical NTP pyrophosphatase (MazG superfamily)